jgi:hypothetical protein
MSFGGGNVSSGVSAHVHNNNVGEGGALQFKNDINTGTSVQFDGGTEVVAEVLT